MIPCGMKQDDARKLDHATLEAMRIREPALAFPAPPH
jgi:hypothetical protein